MFKKGDVVEFVTRGAELVDEDQRFVVRVLEDQKEQSHFIGQVIDKGRRAHDRVGTISLYWNARQFKLKQQTVVSDNTHDNVFPVLKDGMVIETRCRGFYLVCADKVIRHDGYNRVTSYEKNGKHKGNNSNFDIVRVYSGEHLYNFDLYEYVSDYTQDLVWNGKKNADKIASLRSQVDSLQEQIKQLEEEDNV